MEHGGLATYRTKRMKNIDGTIWTALINGIVSIVSIIWQSKKTRKEVKKGKDEILENGTQSRNSTTETMVNK